MRCKAGGMLIATDWLITALAAIFSLMDCRGVARSWSQSE